MLKKNPLVLDTECHHPTVSVCIHGRFTVPFANKNSFLRPMNQRTQNYLARFVERLQSEGRYSFTLNELRRAFELSDEALKKALHRLVRKQKIGLSSEVSTWSCLRGYAHFLSETPAEVFLFGQRGDRLPGWFKQYPWGVKVECQATDFLSEPVPESLSGISLGSGKRVVVKNGALDRKYQITVPREFV